MAEAMNDWQLLSKKHVWERGEMLPPPSGVLKSALLWEGRMQLNRLELHWPKRSAGAAAAGERGAFACIRPRTAGLVGNRISK